MNIDANKANMFRIGCHILQKEWALFRHCLKKNLNLGWVIRICVYSFCSQVTMAIRWRKKTFIVCFVHLWRQMAKYLDKISHKQRRNGDPSGVHILPQFHCCQVDTKLRGMCCKTNNKQTKKKKSKKEKNNQDKKKKKKRKMCILVVFCKWLAFSKSCKEEYIWHVWLDSKEKEWNENVYKMNMAVKCIVTSIKSSKAVCWADIWRKPTKHFIHAVSMVVED